MNADVRRKILLLGDADGVTPFKDPLKGRLHKLLIPIADPHYPPHVIHCFGDESGRVRRVLGCTSFCLVTDWKYQRDVAQADIRYAAKYFHYIRAGRRIGESADGGYFGARSVLEPWATPMLCEAIEYGAQFDMRWQLTLGYQFTSIQQQLDYEGNLGHELQRRGLAPYIFLIEENEPWQNSWLKRDPEEWAAQNERIDRQYKAIMNPAPWFAPGAPQDESPHLILKHTGRDRVCEIHTNRERALMLKRVHALHYMEGHPGYVVTEEPEGSGNKVLHDGVWYVLGEPTPAAGGPDDFMGTPDVGAQVAQHFMHYQIGGPSTYFDGWDVRSPEPLWADAPTLESIPMFARNVPEDACTWPPLHGGSIWHWNKPDTNIVLTVIDEGWYRDQETGKVTYRSPRPWLRWTAYGSTVDANGKPVEGGCMIEGTGPLVLPAGFDGAAVMGEVE